MSSLFIARAVAAAGGPTLQLDVLLLRVSRRIGSLINRHNILCIFLWLSVICLSKMRASKPARLSRRVLFRASCQLSPAAGRMGGNGEIHC